MSETLPTVEQLQTEKQKNISQLGVYDYEYRVLLGQYQAIGERLKAVEEEKQKVTQTLANIDHTYKLVLEKEAKDGEARSEDSGNS